MRGTTGSLLDEPECMGGYRHIGHTLKMQRVSVPRSTVEASLSRELASKGAAERRAHRNSRPNDTWNTHCPFHFRRGVHKLSSFDVDKFCRGVFKFLPCCSQTVAVAFSRFCRGGDKVLPLCSTTLICRTEVFVTLSKSYFRPFKNKSVCLKLK